MGYMLKNRLTINYFKERASKSGIDAFFTKYLYHSEKLSLLRLMIRSTVFGIHYITHNIIAKSFVLLKNRSYYIWFIVAVLQSSLSI